MLEELKNLYFLFYPNKIADEGDEETALAMQALTKKWMENWWGERCPDFEENCYCCQAWKAFDVMFNEVGE